MRTPPLCTLVIWEQLSEKKYKFLTWESSDIFIQDSPPYTKDGANTHALSPTPRRWRLRIPCSYLLRALWIFNTSLIFCQYFYLGVNRLFFTHCSFLLSNFNLPPKCPKFPSTGLCLGTIFNQPCNLNLRKKPASTAEVQFLPKLNPSRGVCPYKSFTLCLTTKF